MTGSFAIALIAGGLVLLGAGYKLLKHWSIWKR